MAKKKSGYKISDVKQAVIGAFMTVLLFFALRAGEEGPFLNPITGSIMTIVWIGILYKSFKRINGNNFIVNVFVVFCLCILLTIGFELATFEQIRENPMGSPAMIATWMALPIALMFDKMNVTSVYSRYYFKKQKQ